MKRWSLLAVTAALCAAVPLAWAVQPARWHHTTEAHFTTGELDGAVSNSLGEVALAREIKVLVDAKGAPPVVSCVAVAGHAVFAGAGNEPVVYKIQGGKVTKSAPLPSTMIASLYWTGRELLVGTGGEKAGIYRLDGAGKAKPVWVDPKVKYVWAILPHGEGGLLAATGPEGKVFAVGADGKAQVIYHADKLAKNILCLAAGKNGTLYAGTDEKGLVVEIDPKAKAGRVLFDAPEKEIAALVVAEDGGVFAATSDASKASADGAKKPSTSKVGKADNGKKPPAKPKAAETKPAPKPDDKKPAAKPDDKKAEAKPQPKPTEKPKPEQKPKDKPKETPKPPAKPDEKPEDKPEEKPKDKPAEKPKEKAEPSSPTEKPGDAISKRPASVRPRPAPKPSGPSSGSKPSPRQPSPTPPSGVRVVRRPTSTSKPPTPSTATGGPGNAVYRIRADGLVETVFRRPVTILAMVEHAGQLVLGTGNGGAIYATTTDGDVISMLVDTDAKQVTSLAAGPDGQLLFATANKGSVGLLTKGFGRKGTLIAKPLDAKQIAKWGTIRLQGRAPAGTKVTIATRSGNVAEPDEKTWSSWSKEAPLQDGYVSVGAPAGRFIQYRLTLTSNGKATPAVDGVEMVYQVGNLAPSLTGVVLQASPKGRSSSETAGGALAWRHITIQAADQNGDKLRITLQYRRAGTEPWITLTDKLTQPKFIWDTRSMPDGVFELRVVASDDPSNPPASAEESARISEPFAIDNTRPTVSKLTAKLNGTAATVTGLAEDGVSRILRMAYSVSGEDKWVSVLPDDGICDSNREAFSFEIEGLSPGVRQVSVRVVDAMGNVGFGSVIVNVGKDR